MQLVMKTFFRILLALIALFVGGLVAFAYDKNVCPGRERLVRTEADAIAVAKNWIVKDSFFDKEKFGGAQEILNLVNDTPKTITAHWERNFWLVEIWHINIRVRKGETGLWMMMDLSNCGDIFAESKYSITE